MTTVETSNLRMNKSVQVTRCIFTCNNYDYEIYFKQKSERIKRMLIGFQCGSESGTRHLQGFVEFNRSIRYSIVRQILHNAFWRPALPSSRANFEYHVKSGDYFVIISFQREENHSVSVRYKISSRSDFIVFSTSEVTEFRKNKFLEKT